MTNNSWTGQDSPFWSDPDNWSSILGTPSTCHNVFFTIGRASFMDLGDTNPYGREIRSFTVSAPYPLGLKFAGTLVLTDEQFPAAVCGEVKPLIRTEYGDFNGDCTIDDLDFERLGEPGAAPNPPNPLYNAIFDYDGDCAFGETDFDEFMSRYEPGEQVPVSCTVPQGATAFLMPIRPDAWRDNARAPPDATVVDLFASSASNIRGYEVALDVLGPTGARVTSIRLEVEGDRSDALVRNRQRVVATNLAEGRFACALFSGGSTATGSTYLGSVRIPIDAAQEFGDPVTIRVRESHTRFVDTEYQRIAVISPDDLVVLVDPR